MRNSKLASKGNRYSQASEKLARATVLRCRRFDFDSSSGPSRPHAQGIAFEIVIPLSLSLSFYPNVLRFYVSPRIRDFLRVPRFSVSQGIFSGYAIRLPRFPLSDRVTSRLASRLTRSTAPYSTTFPRFSDLRYASVRPIDRSSRIFNFFSAPIATFFGREEWRGSEN